MIGLIRKNWPFLMGLALLAIYWASLHPTGRGYVEDVCTAETARQIMAENLARFGRPAFTTDSYGAPTGISVAFLPWSIEQHWIGGWFWNWNREFPFLYVWFGLSLLLSYLGTGAILRKMDLPRTAAWGLAALVTVVHAPRHLKAWHHYEHLLQHWITLSLFLDAWIWKRFWRDRKVSIGLETWRAFLMIAMLATAGYYWGALILEWTIVRACMLGIHFRRGGTKVIRDWRRALLPLGLGVAGLIVALQWLLPLKAEADKLGNVWQPMGWFSSIFTVIRPLWLEPVYGSFLRIFPSFPIPLNPLTQYETLTAIGWVFWIPAIIGIRSLARKRGGPGAAAALPFLILLGIAIEFVSIKPHWLQEFLRATVPFMSFFRVGSRWGLIFPQLVTILIALSWPELSRWFNARWADTAGHPRFHAACVGFMILCVLETHVLFRRPEMLSALPGPMHSLLNDVRKQPGTTVLDMPFCLAGGNEVCTFAKCRYYPASTAGACFHGWHDKKVFGIYESRLVESQCTLYDPPPYSSWIEAWNSDRCFTPLDWREFCGFLGKHPEIGSILVYPDLWKAAGTPACSSQFQKHLGPPRAEASFSTVRTLGGEPAGLTRVRHYEARCRD